MIVPGTRLLVVFALAGMPLIGLATFVPSMFALSAALLGVIVVTALGDAFLSSRFFDGVTVQMPEVVHLSKNRDGQIHGQLKLSCKTKQVRIGLDLPSELHPQQDSLTLTVSDQEDMPSSFTFTCNPSKRGNFVLNACYLEVYSTLKLWVIRTSVPIQTEIRVYPNLVTEQKKLSALFLNRGTFGLHAQRQIGKGREFEKLREYIPGDSYEDIHWKATARRGHPITKVYQLERTQEVYVVLDASRMSGKSVRQAANLDSATTVLEYLVTSALIVGLAAEKQGDLFGLIAFDKQILRFVRAKSGKSHYRTCRDALYALEPSNATPDFEELASFISLRLRRRALIIILTNLDDPLIAEGFVKTMDMIRQKHLILVNMVKPEGIKPVFSDSHVNTTNDIYESLGYHLQWANLWELKKLLQSRGITFSTIDKERLSVELVSQYINVKQRQLL
ncbi:MAG TPA: DUF58 domain-containing protein [Thermodesulfovibrionia bacterium]|nr:DUF58 domain-containing protein [Thermodesulfovibrionia bacterium]